MGARFTGVIETRRLMPPSLRDWVSEGHLVWTVLDAVTSWICRRFTRTIATTGVAGRRMSHEPSTMAALSRDLSANRGAQPRRGAT